MAFGPIITYGPVAQWIARLTLNQKVESSPLCRGAWDCNSLQSVCMGLGCLNECNSNVEI